MVDSSVNSMADFGRPRKRRRRREVKRKFVLGEKVEVRSLEDGFLGSWHCGTIISCGNRVCQVRYDHLLCDDSSEHLTENVEVYSKVDGSNNLDLGSLSTYRGRIRPVFPVMKPGKTLCYGLCVDAYHNDAWWEGVVFDREDDLEERKIFFPDLGDEMILKVDVLRITHDWNEVTEEWKPRGKWLLMEIIEDYEFENIIPVSVKQLWYDLRGNKNFDQIVEWTFSMKVVWQKLIDEVLKDNMRLFLDNLVKRLDFSKYLMQRSGTDSAFGYNLNLDSHLNDPHDLVSCQDGHCNGDAIMVTEGSMTMSGEVGCSGVTNDLLNTSNIRFCSICEGLLSSSDNKPKRVPGSTEKRQRCALPGRWHPAGPRIVPRAEFCPHSVANFRHCKKRRGDLTINLRKHLLYLGWKIDHTNDGGISRVRYTSPCGSLYYSLVTVCQHLKENESEDFPPAEEHVRESFLDSPDHVNCLTQFDERHVTMDHLSSFALLDEPHVMSDGPLVEPGCCPDAIIEYLHLWNNPVCKNKRRKSEGLAEKARKHLSAAGWTLWITMKKGRPEWRYDSPQNKTYYSLRTACEGILTGGMVTHGLPISSPLKGVSSYEDQSVGNPSPVYSEVQGNVVLNQSSKRQFTKLWKTKRLCTSFSSKHQVGSGSLGKSRNGSDGNQPKWMLRSSKRARQAVTHSLSRNPRNVLSWLIDNNVVLPRTKVYYCSRKDCQPLAEGRVTRDGIRCSCCLKVFTLTGFEAHAGSSLHRPSANIFLEDGRSLVECQMQMIQSNPTSLSSEPLELGRKNRHKIKNDHICSVCHYGGKLILCDQCPSSYHTSCLNMQKVTGSVRHVVVEFVVKTNLMMMRNNSRVKAYFAVTNVSVNVNHVSCMSNRGMVGIDARPKDAWFCCKMCEKICLGLQMLLGKRINVGPDNLTWTLIKHMRHEIDDPGQPNAEDVADNYSKLSVALEVMHECFERVKEPRTRRDLVEDVIFSRGSELKRLNFRGFYTVILEKNDEMITVATVRVYGEKVAEVPLVGTRFQYRRLGMCRVLMNELENMLVGLGVERLILPAVPSVLNTWTTAFGFSQMTKSERSEFLGYTFLDFQDTVMCQKLLKELPPCEYIILNVTHHAVDEKGSRSSSSYHDGNSTICEVFQEEQIEGDETVDQGPVNATEGKCNDGSNSLVPPAAEGKQPAEEDEKQSHLSSPQYCLKHTNSEKVDRYSSDGHLRCYKRKKTMDTRSVPRADYPNLKVSCR
ncbi:hypothetical protein Ancab_031414 [Ancistrocladus abbreviatus]